VADAGRSMTEIVDSVRRVTDMIGEISTATDEQSAGLGAVNLSVNELDQMTQQNAALVEQSAAAAESLRAQATRLSQVVQVFQVSGRRGCSLTAERQSTIRPPLRAPGVNSGPILKTPLTRATGVPSACTSPCAKTSERVVRSTWPSPCTQAPSGVARGSRSAG
jgi:hypothetical protein